MPRSFGGEQGDGVGSIPVRFETRRKLLNQFDLCNRQAERSYRTEVIALRS